MVFLTAIELNSATKSSLFLSAKYQTKSLHGGLLLPGTSQLKQTISLVVLVIGKVNDSETICGLP